MTEKSLFDDVPSQSKSAVFSPCRKYRYALYRTWDERLASCMFVGLNPSTADETKNDPTIRRCINFAKRWGCGGLIMANLFAFRATKPEDMKAAADPVGPENDRWLIQLHNAAGLVIAAWGRDGVFRERGAKVLAMLRRNRDGGDIGCFGLTENKQPKHPLYIKGDTSYQIIQ